MFRLVALIVLALPVCAAADRPLTALAPFETYADGFTTLRGIAVDAAGAVYVADRAAGTVSRIAPDHARSVVATGLERPIGLAFDTSGRLLIAEERAARVVRVEPNGARTPVVTGIKQPRWLAVHDDGTLYITARRLTRGTDPDPDDESAEPEMILALSPAGALSVVADGFKQLQGLAANHDAIFAATQGRRHEARVDGVVFRIPILPGGAAGAPLPVGPGDDFKKPIGLARDRLGALYLTTRELTLLEDRSRRAVAKLHANGHVTLFAENLDNPQGLAFDAAGNLFVADGNAGRIVKFRAPAAPTPMAPEITRLSPLAVTGHTEPGARVDLFVNDAPAPAGGLADAAGLFALSVGLAANASNTLETFATAHHGDGLTSASTRTTIAHDAIAPTLAFQAPPANAHVRLTVSVQAAASDGGTVASLTLGVDGKSLAATRVPAPPATSVSATAAWNTLSVPDGGHTLAAFAADAAGNAATTSRVVVVDNTPPDTEITGGPSGSITGPSATFGFTGSDNLTPAANLEFAWRLDAGAFSEFSPATSVTLAGLGAGPHTFEVKARDRAGNEDPTPARRAFSVGALSVTITEPADAASVSEGLVVVRGTVTGADGDVSVLVNATPAIVVGTAYSTIVAVSPATAAVTAVATSGGATASATLSLNVVAADPNAPGLRVTPPVGAAPLAVRFALVGGPTPQTIELDLDGNGTVDFTGPTLDDRPFTYATPGTYLARVTVTDGTGRRSSATAGVFVLDGAALDAAFQARWQAVKGGLRRGAIEEALTHIAVSQRDNYREIFTTISGRLPAIDQILTDISFVEHQGIWVEYEMVRIEDGLATSYFILFVLDEDGIWRLEFF